MDSRQFSEIEIFWKHVKDSQVSPLPPLERLAILIAGFRQISLLVRQKAMLMSVVISAVIPAVGQCLGFAFDTYIYIYVHMRLKKSLHHIEFPLKT